MQRAMAELWFSNRRKNGRTLNRHDDEEKQLRHYEWARRRSKAVQPLDPRRRSMRLSNRRRILGAAGRCGCIRVPTRFNQNGTLGCVLVQTNGEALPITADSVGLSRLRPWVHRLGQFDPAPVNIREMSPNGHDFSAFMFWGGVRWVSRM
jgi:hypothetical protein